MLFHSTLAMFWWAISDGWKQSNCENSRIAILVNTDSIIMQSCLISTVEHLAAWLYIVLRLRESWWRICQTWHWTQRAGLPLQSHHGSAEHSMQQSEPRTMIISKFNNTPTNYIFVVNTWFLLVILTFFSILLISGTKLSISCLHLSHSKYKKLKGGYKIY